MNIEKTRGEDVLSEVQNIATTQIAKATDEAIYKRYVEDVNFGKYLPSHDNGSIISNITELSSVLRFVITKTWTTALSMLGGVSVLDTLTDCWQWLKNRLKGDETCGIPTIAINPNVPLSQYLKLLNNRRIGGSPDAPDGVSIVHLLNELTSEITELTDNATGWTLSKDPLTTFPNATRMNFGCSYMTLLKLGNADTEDLQLPNIEELLVRDTAGTSARRSLLVFKNEVLELPKLQRLEGTTAWSGAGFVQDNNYVKVINMPLLNYFRHCRLHGMISYCANLQEVNMGEVTYLKPNIYNEQDGLFAECPNMITLKIGDGFNTNLYLPDWNPTNALDSTLATLVTDTNLSNNLEQFLKNFREYIILRLAKRDSSSTLSLTLSGGVYQAVYGLDIDYNTDPTSVAQTTTLADLGITSDDLTDTEVDAGITTSTTYALWLDTYRNAIYWNIGHA